MGYYIDPETETKEQFLQRVGRRLPSATAPVEPEELLVCLVDNGFFSAAGIMYGPHEIQEFNDPRDFRPKSWWAVSREDLKPYYQG